MRSTAIGIVTVILAGIAMAPMLVQTELFPTATAQDAPQAPMLADAARKPKHKNGCMFE